MKLIFKFCRVVQSQSWIGKGLSRSSPFSHPPTPRAWLRLPLPSLGQARKKVSLSRTAVDRADRLGGWSRQMAGTIFIYFTCVVYQNQSLQMRQRVTCLAAEIWPFSVFFGSKIQPVSAHRPHRVVWHKKMC